MILSGAMGKKSPKHAKMLTGANKIAPIRFAMIQSPSIYVSNKSFIGHEFF
jgi:hypothetical protein